MLVDGHSGITHHPRTALPDLLQEGDLVIANDAATLPASLDAIHARTGQRVEVRLAGRDSLDSDNVSRFTAVVFGAGDFRTPTEQRLPPPELIPGDLLLIGAVRARVATIRGHARLVDLEFEHDPGHIWELLAHHGRPIQYAYVRSPLALWDTWTPIASQPVAFEPPSAGFVLDWTVLRTMRSRGARFATLTHAAGISSTGDAELDRLLPFDEPYLIPSSTAALVVETKRASGRVVAIGTTVVRALEHAACHDASVRVGGRVGEGLATGRIGPRTPLRIVDAIVSGMHEPESSHYQLLRAFQRDEALARMSAEAETHGYLAHEFGDAVFIERAVTESSRSYGAMASA
jgi:S-adenosylmethionine:tRNA ribosyltransferase-isomerase